MFLPAIEITALKYLEEHFQPIEHQLIAFYLWQHKLKEQVHRELDFVFWQRRLIKVHRDLDRYFNPYARNSSFGQRVQFNIARNGDLLNNMYLQVQLPAIETPSASFRWVNDIRHQLLNSGEQQYGNGPMSTAAAAG